MTLAQTNATVIAKPGKRAENKADKLRRITVAARELFVENGFDGTTMRDIAARAKVGFGTIFDYATSKRELLFLIVNPELEGVLDETIAAAATETALIDKLMAMFGGYYAFYAREKGLSRMVLRELTFFVEGAESRKFAEHRQRFIDAVTMEVRGAIDRGGIRPVSPELVSRTIFGIYAWEVRRWLANPAPSVARGLADLRELLMLQIEGLAPVRP